MSFEVHAKKLLAAVLGIAAFSTLVPAASGTEFVVTRSGDPALNTCADGDCSLRGAILAANNEPGPDVVFLGVGGITEYTLSIARTALPQLRDKAKGCEDERSI